MIMTRSRNGSRNPSRGASPVHRGGGDDDRSPFPSITPCKSRCRMQMPSATTKSQAAAKSDSPPRGRTMTLSSSCAASRCGSPQAADNVKIVVAAADCSLSATAAHYQPLHAKHPDLVRAPSVSRRGYSDSSPNFSSSRLGRASAKRDKSVERNNGSGNLRRS